MSSSCGRPPAEADPPKIPDRYFLVSDPKAKPGAIVSGAAKNGYYRFTILTHRLLRYEWSEDGGFEDRASTFALFRNFEDVPSYHVTDGPKRLEINTTAFTLQYDKKKFFQEGLQVFVGGDVWKHDGKSYGDLGGTARTLDQADGRIDLAPGVLSRKKAYAVLDDSESMLFGEDGWIAVRRCNRKDGYLFAHNGDYRGAIHDFYRLSGPQPVLPRWTLGNWWSRYHAYSQEEYLSVMHKFRDNGIPLTVGVLDMDWHKVNIPPQYGSGWTGYSWNRELFPNPDLLLKQLRELGLKVTLNDHPADGIRAFEDQYEEVARFLNHDTSNDEPIQFDCTDRKFLDAYFDVLKANLEKQGVDFWWIDWQQGNKSKIPGVDPLWVLNHYHYQTSRRNIHTTEKPITFSRYAGPGSHRYPIGFSGDTLITWASLQFQPEFTATASNIGYGWWSHDIGGHFWGVRSNDLTARWVQFGCFSPILRLHSEKSQWNSKEPWKYEPETAEIMKRYLIFRHRMIPYLQSMNIRASYQHQPLIQPMYWDHREDAAYTVPNQYYFGVSLIAIPITQPLSRTTLMGPVKAWLPKGRYVDIFHPTLVYDGDRHFRLHRSLWDIPVLAKEGSIFVLDGRAAFHNGVTRPDELEINLVVGASGMFWLLEEPEHQNRASVRPPQHEIIATRITWDQEQGRLRIKLACNRTKGDRSWTVKLLGVTSGVEAVPKTSEHSDAHFEVEYNKVEGWTTVRFGNLDKSNLGPESCFDVFLGNNLQLDVLDITKRMHDMLYRCEMVYPVKENVWQLTTQDRAPVEERVAKLLEMDIDASLKDAVMEIWAADGRARGSAKGLEKWIADDAPAANTTGIETVEPVEMKIGAAGTETEEVKAVEAKPKVVETRTKETKTVTFSEDVEVKVASDVESEESDGPKLIRVDREYVQAENVAVMHALTAKEQGLKTETFKAPTVGTKGGGNADSENPQDPNDSSAVQAGNSSGTAEMGAEVATTMETIAKRTVAETKTSEAPELESQGAINDDSEDWEDSEDSDLEDSDLDGGYVLVPADP